MAKITYKSSIPNDKPLWLLKLQLAVSQLDATELKGNEQDFRNLKSFIDAVAVLWKPNFGRMKAGR